MRLVVALGGNALLRRGERLDLDLQRRHVRQAVAALGGLAGRHDLLLTHGNGPQVGLLALQAHAYRLGPSVSLDVLGAESEGMIGYVLEQELTNALPDRDVATLLTQVQVDPRDPAFQRPTKPIGPVFTREAGERLARERGWTMAADGAGVRRVVPSPRPLRISALPAIRHLLDGGFIVIGGGGGGIPVVAAADGRLSGVEAVVDKDHTAALLAEGTRADALVLLTDTPGVYLDYGGPGQQLITRMGPSDLTRLSLDAGSMGPKLEAACRFVDRTGGWAAIGRLEDLEEVVAGTSGTRIERGAAAIAAVAASSREVARTSGGGAIG